MLRAVASRRDGLTIDEAARRLRLHGRNELPEARGPTAFRRFLAQFNNTIIHFLLLAAIAASALGQHVDAAVIMAVVLVNAIVGFVQEGKAEAALSSIWSLITLDVTVLREQRRHTIPAAELVPGDLVLLDAGDRVPADLRLLHARSLLIDESALTGESVAAEKRVEPASLEAAIGDRHSMAYSGTYVAAGHAIGVVVTTGADSEIGRIGTLLEHADNLTTPLLRQINRFGRHLAVAAFGGAALLFTFSVTLRGFDWIDALMATVAIAVAAVPENLLAVITITLAIGVQRMARRKAVIRHLPAVETLGATSVICTDKTGTLTLNEMTATRVELSDGRFVVSGSGYAPEGELTPLLNEGAECTVAALPLIEAGLLCNNAELHSDDGRWRVNGDPMEGALVALAMKAGLDPKQVRAAWPRVDVIPFDAEYRFMATLNRGPGNGAKIFVKGAPEQLLRMCRCEARGHHTVPLDADAWRRRIEQAAAEGERLIGIAVSETDRVQEALVNEMLDEGLVFLGMVGFVDPPREEVIDAIADCRTAGIAVKMITGDHAVTAAAIARQLGFDEPHVMTGSELDGIRDDQLPAVAERTSVFARTSPEHKLRIVRALQRTGAIVAMTGDGVNDSPSLKQADVGIAMGVKGTDTAKRAAQMVLLDDNFASIVAAVHEGRAVFDNIRKVVAWQLPTNGGEVLGVIAAIVFSFALPATPVQILWLNLVTSATLGLTLAFEPAEPNVMRRKPRRPDEPLLTPFLLWRVFIVSMLFMGVSLSFFFFALSQGEDIAVARTMVVNSIVVLETVYLFNIRYLHMTSITWRGAIGTPAVLISVAAVIILQLAFTYLPFMHAVFDSRPISLGMGLMIVAAGIAVMIALEIEKLILRRMGRLSAPD